MSIVLFAFWIILGHVCVVGGIYYIESKRDFALEPEVFQLPEVVWVLVSIGSGVQMIIIFFLGFLGGEVTFYGLPLLALVFLLYYGLQLYIWRMGRNVLAIVFTALPLVSLVLSQLAATSLSVALRHLAVLAILMELEAAVPVFRKLQADMVLAYAARRSSTGPLVQREEGLKRPSILPWILVLTPLMALGISLVLAEVEGWDTLSFIEALAVFYGLINVLREFLSNRPIIALEVFLIGAAPFGLALASTWRL